MARRTTRYTIRFSNYKTPHEVSARLFFEWLGRGFIKQTGHKKGRMAPGYIGWFEEGELRIKHLWTVIGPYIRTNSRMFELLALYAIWTPSLTPIEMQWEIQSSYNTDLRWNTLTVGADLGRTVFNEAG